MIIKKCIALLLTLLCCSNFISCDSLGNKMINQRLQELNKSNKAGDKHLEKILSAFQYKDKEALKKEFSVSALKTSKNIDEDIDYIMNFFEGEIISIKDGTGRGLDSSSDGVKVVEDTYRYIVTTDKGSYVFFLIYISEDTFNPDNVGLYMLQVIDEKNIENECDDGQSIRCPGIYCPPVSKYTDIKFQDGTEIAGGFKFLKYQEDHSDGKYNIRATIQSEIAYGNVSISFCFYDANGKKIGLSTGGKTKLDAGSTFEINLTAEDYDGKDLRYEDIASYKFFGINAY